MNLQGLDLPSVSYVGSSTQVNQWPTPSEDQIRAYKKSIPTNLFSFDPDVSCASM